MSESNISNWMKIYKVSRDKALEQIRRVLVDTKGAHRMVDDTDIDWEKCRKCTYVDYGLRGCYWNFIDCDKHYTKSKEVD